MLVDGIERKAKKEVMTKVMTKVISADGLSEIRRICHCLRTADPSVTFSPPMMRLSRSPRGPSRHARSGFQWVRRHRVVINGFVARDLARGHLSIEDAMQTSAFRRFDFNRRSDKKGDPQMHSALRDCASVKRRVVAIGNHILAGASSM
jgi:hypothetical protein